MGFQLLPARCLTGGHFLFRLPFLEVLVMIYLASRAPDCVRHVAERTRAVVARGGGRGARRVSGGRFARPHAPHVATARRTVALVVLALVLLVPTVARAEVAWQEQDVNYTAVVAPHEYSANGRAAALAEYLGYDWNSLSQEAQNYIASYNNGDNYFSASLAKNVHNVMYESNGTLTWPIISTWSSIFGLDNMWDITMSSGQYNSAVAEFQESLDAWVAQSGLGGGGNDSPDSSDGYTLIPCQLIDGWSYKPNSSMHGVKIGSTYVDWISLSSYSEVTLRITDSLYRSLIPAKGYVTFVVLYVNGAYATNGGKYYYNGWNVNSVSVSADDYNVESPYGNANFNFGVRITGSGLKYGDGSNRYYFNDDNVITASFGTPYNSSSAYVKNTVVWLAHIDSDGHIVTGPGEPTYPTPPDPPEIPEPDPPVTRPIDDPGIQLPTINWPDISMPDVDFTVNMPTGEDVIPYLKKIISNQEDIASFLADAFGVLDADLDNIGTALGEHCNHLQQQMQKQAYWLATELQDMFDGLEVGISNYLYRVQTKLLQGIGWEFDNLSQDVIAWLKRIYSRMGGNGISKPDPTTDTKGFWDWLIEQFAKFFEDLFGKSTSGLNSLFDSLKEFFPFSLPWDILALLGLFVHEPVTPVFDLPMPVPQVISGTQMQLIHVDCHQWDATMQIVRSLEFVFFAYHLMRMVPSWFNEIKVAGM